jgi:hypothetical protein
VGRRNVKNEKNTLKNVDSYGCDIKALFRILNNEALYCIFEMVKEELDYGIIFVKPPASRSVMCCSWISLELFTGDIKMFKDLL